MMLYIIGPMTFQMIFVGLLLETLGVDKWQQKNQ